MERVINCKRICLDLEYKHKRGEAKYRPGVVRCNKCCDGIFIKIDPDKYICPCCKSKVRASPRNKSKHFYDIEREEKEDSTNSTRP